MKTKKNVLIVLIVLGLVGLLTIGTVALIDNSNRNHLSTMVDILSDTVKDEMHDEPIEIQSVYGKLNGNGNGIQYFGAVLIEKASIENPDLLIAKLDSRFEIVGIIDQKDSKITSKYLQNKSLNYEFEFDPGKDYISVFFYNSSYPMSNDQDVLGH